MPSCLNLPRLLLAMTTFVAVIAPARAQETLHERVDQSVESNQIGPLAPVVGDAEFLRRASLDFTGLIPTSAETRTFLDDPSPNKRELAIDRLIASARFSVYFANVLDVALMERRPDKHITTAEWQAYLQNAIEQNKPYNQLAREILSADGADPATRPAAKFFLDRDAEPHSSGRDVGRMFFGMDLQCAQCHDHPLIDHYLQADYYGLHAFVNRTEVFNDQAQKKAFLTEKSSGDASYKSVFTGDAANTRPQLPGDSEIEEPRFRQGEDYSTVPAPNVRGVPKHSRRGRLAELATNGSNRQFNINISNRLWAHLMGRGLVHPVDLHHPANPPSHPAVLEMITNEFVAHNFNIKWLLRELALTRTYQRSIDPPLDATARIAAASQLAVSIEPELTRLKSVAEESRKQANIVREEVKAVRAAVDSIEAAWKKAEATVAEAKKPVDAAVAAIAKAQADAQAKQSVLNTINEALAKSSEAAKAIANDKEIAAAVATFTARQQQLMTELTAIQKTVTDQTAIQQAAQVKLVESYGPADTAYASFVEANKPLDAVKLKLLAAWTQHCNDALAVSVLKKRLDGLQLQVAFGNAQAGTVTAQNAVDAAKIQQMAAIQSTEQQQAELNKQTSLVAEAEKGTVEASRQLDEAKVQYSTKQNIVQVLQDATSKAEVALQKLPGDPELTIVVQKLKERQEPVAKEAISLEQAVVARDAASKEMANRLSGLKQTLVAMMNEMTARQNLVTAKTNSLNESLAAVQTSQATMLAIRNQLIEISTANCGIRSLKHLSPEQFGWSLMQATGVIDPQRPGIDGEIEKTIPKATVASDPVKSRARDAQGEALLWEKNRGNLGAFITIYAQSAGQPQDDFFATPDQALFVANGGSVIGWSAGGQLAQKLISLEDPKLVGEELYLSVLNRRPSEVELNEVVAQLAARPTEKGLAIRDMIWALATSAEFRFNH